MHLTHNEHDDDATVVTILGLKNGDCYMRR